MQEYDVDLVASLVLRALRGERSQVAFSRRLGYRGNVAYQWESGRRWPTAAVFLAAAERVGIDVVGGLKRFYRTPPGWLDDVAVCTPEGVATLLDDLRGTTPIVELAAQAGRSRFAVARWLKGQTEPRLPDFFRVIEASSLRLLDFLAIFVDPGQLAPVRRAWERLEAARSVFYDHPWTQLVLLALELEAAGTAKDQVGWIADRIGMPRDDVDAAIALLAQTGQIRREGRCWAVGRVQAIDTRRYPDAGRMLKEFWSGVALTHLQRDSDGLFSYNVFTVSEEDYARIQALYRDTYRAMRAIVGRSEPGERVVLANIQLLALDAP